MGREAERGQAGWWYDNAKPLFHILYCSDTLSLVGLCEYKGTCMPIQRYVTYTVWIHLSEFIIVRKRTQGGWNVNSP